MNKRNVFIPQTPAAAGRAGLVDERRGQAVLAQVRLRPHGRRKDGGARRQVEEPPAAAHLPDSHHGRSGGETSAKRMHEAFLHCSIIFLLKSDDYFADCYCST